MTKMLQGAAIRSGLRRIVQKKFFTAACDEPLTVDLLGTKFASERYHHINWTLTLPKPTSKHFHRQNICKHKLP
jgi:molybdopterin-guanine dinucleotide biosynthesis protein A